MALQPVSQTTARFAQLATSSLLMIQATIATTAISAFAPTNLGWLAARPASAQTAQRSIPMPGITSTSAASLKSAPSVIDCSTVTALPVPNCQTPAVLPPGVGALNPGIDPGTLLDAQREINQNTRSKVRVEILPEPPDGVKLQLRIPLP